MTSLSQVIGFGIQATDIHNDIVPVGALSTWFTLGSLTYKFRIVKTRIWRRLIGYVWWGSGSGYWGPAYAFILDHPIYGVLQSSSSYDPAYGHLGPGFMGDWEIIYEDTNIYSLPYSGREMLTNWFSSGTAPPIDSFAFGTGSEVFQVTDTGLSNETFYLNHAAFYSANYDSTTGTLSLQYHLNAYYTYYNSSTITEFGFFDNNHKLFARLVLSSPVVIDKDYEYLFEIHLTVEDDSPSTSRITSYGKQMVVNWFTSYASRPDIYIALSPFYPSSTYNFGLVGEIYRVEPYQIEKSSYDTTKIRFVLSSTEPLADSGTLLPVIIQTVGLVTQDLAAYPRIIDKFDSTWNYSGIALPSSTDVPYAYQGSACMNCGFTGTADWAYYYHSISNVSVDTDYYVFVPLYIYEHAYYQHFASTDNFVVYLNSSSYVFSLSENFTPGYWNALAITDFVGTISTGTFGFYPVALGEFSLGGTYLGSAENVPGSLKTDCWYAYKYPDYSNLIAYLITPTILKTNIFNLQGEVQVVIK